MWPILLNNKVYSKGKLTGYDITTIMYDRMNYRCGTVRKPVTTQNLTNAVSKNMVFPLNFTMKSNEVVVRYKYNDGEDIIRKIAAKLRTFLERQYGSGTALAGHCIEACCYLETTLNYMGLQGTKQIEGWCLWDDEYYGSDRPFDEHTWLEIGGHYYLDITADQFNPGFSTENHFKPVEFRVFCPDEMRKTKPVEGRDYWLDC